MNADSAGVVSCPQCDSPLPESFLNQGAFSACPSCQSLVKVDHFPALFRKISPGKGAEPIVVSDDASCFQHPKKKAVTACESCGRFLCLLCDIELDGRHLCPACLESGRNAGKLQNLETHRTLYDSIALTLVFAPLVLFFVFWIGIVTAPTALFVVIRYWKAPTSILPRTRFWMVLAGILASAEIVGMIVGAAMLFIMLLTRT